MSLRPAPTSAEAGQARAASKDKLVPLLMPVALASGMTRPEVGRSAAISLTGNARKVFEKTYLRRFRTVFDNTFSLGCLAELALFYETTIVEIKEAWIAAALRLTSIDTLLRLSREFGIRFIYVVDNVGSIHQRQSRSLFSYYDIGFFFLDPEREVSEGPPEVADRLIKANGFSPEIKDKLIQFLGACDWRYHKDLVPKGLDLTAVFRDELQDRDSCAADMSEIIKHVAPAYSLPEDFRFYGYKLRPRDTMMLVIHNLDLHALTGLARREPNDPVTIPGLLSMYANARMELAVCATLQCDFVSDGVNRAIVDRRVKDVLHRANRNMDEIRLFEERVLGESKAVANVIDKKLKTLDDFLFVLEQATKFKRFLHNADEERGLIDQYIAEVSARSWIDHVPAKPLRFLLFQAASLGAGFMLQAPIAGAAAGVGLGLLDTFLLDTVVKNWRPNQFVDDVLKPYARG